MGRKAQVLSPKSIEAKCLSALSSVKTKMGNLAAALDLMKESKTTKKAVNPRKLDAIIGNFSRLKTSKSIDTSVENVAVDFLEAIKASPVH